jgi:hypothetical protein
MTPLKVKDMANKRVTIAAAKELLAEFLGGRQYTYLFVHLA